MTTKSQWAFKVLAADSESLQLDIYDSIGESFYGGVSAKSVLDKLRAFGDTKRINVRINSLGGDVWDGIAIYNLLREHKAKVTIDIDGIAASAASVIAMAGDKIRMAENAVMMIHCAWTYAIGNAQDMRDSIELLERADHQILVTYAARTGQSKEQLAEWMKATTWMNAEEAKERGFATDITPAKSIAASVGDLSRFKNVPEQILQRFKAPEPPSSKAGDKKEIDMDELEKAKAELAKANASTKALDTVLAEAQAKTVALSAEVAAKDATIRALTTDRDTALASKTKAEADLAVASAKLIELEVDGLVGNKILPTERDAYITLAQSDRKLFDSLVASRPPLALVGEQKIITTEIETVVLENSGDELSAAAEKRTRATQSA